MDQVRFKLVLWCSFLALAVIVVAYLVPAMWRAPAPVAEEPATLPVVTVEPATTASANAVDSYRQAMKLMNDIESAPEVASLYLRYQDGHFDDGAGKFFAGHAAIVRLVRSGAAAPSCEWGDIDPYSILNDVRRISNYTLGDARWAIHQNDTAAAMNDALAVMALARHAGQNPRMLVKLVEVGVMTQGINLMATILPSLSPAQLAAVSARLEALPKSATWSEALMGDYEQGRKDARQQGGNLIMIAMADSLEPFYRELGAAMDQPPAQFDQTADAVSARFKANLVAQQLTPATKARHNTFVNGQTRFAMLQTAVSILRDGPDAVAKSHEPFGSGPFVYTKTDKGFDLTSQLQERGKPITLSVGGP